MFPTPPSKGSIKFGEIPRSSVASKGLMRLGDMLERPELLSIFLLEEPMLPGKASQTSYKTKMREKSYKKKLTTIS